MMSSASLHVPSLRGNYIINYVLQSDLTQIQEVSLPSERKYLNHLTGLKKWSKRSHQMKVQFPTPKLIVWAIFQSIDTVEHTYV